MNNFASSRSPETYIARAFAEGQSLYGPEDTGTFADYTDERGTFHAPWLMTGDFGTGQRTGYFLGRVEDAWA